MNERIDPGIAQVADPDIALGADPDIALGTDPGIAQGGVPEFSVIVPLYNKGRYIRQTLESILRQSVGGTGLTNDHVVASQSRGRSGPTQWQSWPRKADPAAQVEIIVVDDGSTDDGHQVVSSMAAAGAPIRLFRQVNSGVAATRNFGISQATGHWVLCLDADDLLEPAFFETVRAMQAEFAQAVVLATGYSSFQDGRLIGHCGAVVRAGNDFEQIDDLPRRWLDGPLLYVCSTVVRRDVALSMQPCFPPGERCGEDLSFLFRLNQRHAFVYCPRTLVRYRRDDADSLSLTATTEQLHGFWQRLAQEFERDHATPTRMESLRRFVAKARTLRAAQVLEEARVGQARTLLAEVPAALRTRFWWRTRALAAVSGVFPAAARWRHWAFFEDLAVAQEGLLSLGFWALQVYRFGHLRYRFESKLVRYPLGVAHAVLAKIAEMLSGITIGVAANIGRRLRIEHSGGIVVHGASVIGDDCLIRQGVTIGNRRLDDPLAAPVLGDRVNVGAGAKLLGRIVIGDDVSVGANAVVLRDVPSGRSVVGIPAVEVETGPVGAESLGAGPVAAGLVATGLAETGRVEADRMGADRVGAGREGAGMDAT